MIVNSKEPDAWPIAGFTYMIVYKDYKDCKKAEKIVSFLTWALSDQAAADRAGKLLYAPLPKEVTPRVLETIKKITCNAPAKGTKFRSAKIATPVAAVPMTEANQPGAKCSTIS